MVTVFSLWMHVPNNSCPFEHLFQCTLQNTLFHYLSSCQQWNRVLTSSLCSLLCCAVMCYAVMCYAVLRGAVLCCAVLCYAMLCYAMRCDAMRCDAMLCYAMRCDAVLCYAMLCYAVLCYAMLCCAASGMPPRTRPPRKLVTNSLWFSLTAPIPTLRRHWPLPSCFSNHANVVRVALFCV